MKIVQRSLALGSFFVLVLGLSGPGCQQECAPNTVVLDNRDRQLFKDPDVDWICTDIPITPDKPPPPPPPPPLPPPSPPADVSGDHPADADGPKDPDSAIKAMITLGTCMWGYNTSSVNKRLDDLYFSTSRNAFGQAVRSRTACFKDKTNACKAMAECVGIADAFLDPLSVSTEPTFACETGTRQVTLLPTDTNTPLALARWFNCTGMGLECNEDEPYNVCELPRTKCNPYIESKVCVDDVPIDCLLFVPLSEYGWLYQQPHQCSFYGLACDADAYQGYDTDCVGTGAACLGAGAYVQDDNVFDYRLGPIACESPTTLRSCVGRNESVIDCEKLGIGFKCLDGPEPHCGFATECTKDTPVSCDGDSLVVCDAGRIRKVDCKTLGFTTCDATRGICGPNIYDQEGTLK